MAAVLCGPGAGIGADRLKSARPDRLRALAACVSFNNVVATLLSWSHETGPEFEA
jgi:hypothetical protein